MTTKIGQRVRFNDGVAPAFAGLPGTVTGFRHSTINGQIVEVTLDTPTAPALGWSLVSVLGVKPSDIESEVQS